MPVIAISSVVINTTVVVLARLCLGLQLCVGVQVLVSLLSATAAATQQVVSHGRGRGRRAAGVQLGLRLVG
jgi:hypothetical protein